MASSDEQWKTIVGFPHYEVSDQGNFRRTVVRSRAPIGPVALETKHGVIWKEIRGE